MTADLVRTLLTFGLPGALLVVLIILILNPNVAVRWAEIVWALLSHVSRGADRRAVQYGLQWRVNRFADDIARETGNPVPTRAVVQWTGAEEEPTHFFAENRLVLRLHPHERQDRNLVTASVLLVSQTLVRRSKRFLSKRQARSVDLYAVDRLLSASAATALDLFREEIIGPETDADSELADLIRRYRHIDRANLFFAVFVRELGYLGQKLLVRPYNDAVIGDVKKLIEFLVRYTDRKQGEHIPMELQGRVLRCAIMIVALRVKRDIGETRPYTSRLGDLKRAGYETVYLVGDAVRENSTFMTTIANEFCAQSGWRIVDRRSYPSKLAVEDGVRDVHTFLITLRSPQPADVLETIEALAPAADLPEEAAPGPSLDEAVG